MPREVWGRSYFFGRRENVFLGGRCGRGVTGLGGMSGPTWCRILRVGGGGASSGVPERVVAPRGSNVVSDSVGCGQVEVRGASGGGLGQKYFVGPRLLLGKFSRRWRRSMREGRFRAGLGIMVWLGPVRGAVKFGGGPTFLGGGRIYFRGGCAGKARLGLECPVQRGVGFRGRVGIGRRATFLRGWW